MFMFMLSSVTRPGLWHISCKWRTSIVIWVHMNIMREGDAGGQAALYEVNNPLEHAVGLQPDTNDMVFSQ